jgi:hypothetical protein
MKIAALLIASFLSFNCYAACHDEQLNSHVNYISKSIGNNLELDLDLVACKKWPIKNGIAIYALPFIKESKNQTVYSFEIVVAKSLTGSILHRMKTPLALFSNGIAINNVEVDTARYRLNKKTRAFGLRVYYKGSSRVYPVYETQFSLYTASNGVISQVLPDVLLDSFQGDWDGNCDGSFFEAKAIILMGKNKVDGYSDLIVKRTGNHYSRKAEGEDCNDSDKTVEVKRQYYSYQNGIYKKKEK